MTKQVKQPKDFTKREFLEAIIANDLTATAGTGQTIQEKAVDLLNKLNARNEAAKGKQTKKRVDNTEEKAKILDFLEEQAESVKAKEIAVAVDLTVQKVAAVLKQLVAEGEVTRLDLGRNKPLEYAKGEGEGEGEGE